MAIPFGWILSELTKFLDDAMDYNAYLYKFRLGKAWKFSSFSEKKILVNHIRDSHIGHYDNQSSEVMEAYKEIAKNNFGLIRWICRMCLGVFIACIVSAMLSIGFLIIGFPFVCVAIFFISTVLLTYRLV